jgi:hypothetical protein
MLGRGVGVSVARIGVALGRGVKVDVGTGVGVGVGWLKALHALIRSRAAHTCRMAYRVGMG